MAWVSYWLTRQPSVVKAILVLVSNEKSLTSSPGAVFFFFRKVDPDIKRDESLQPEGIGPVTVDPVGTQLKIESHAVLDFDEPADAQFLVGPVGFVINPVRAQGVIVGVPLLRHIVLAEPGNSEKLPPVVG